MHINSGHESLKHSHDYSLQNHKGEKRTFYVLILTAVTMVIEIVAGNVYGSMALLADGWHMGTHVAAFLLAIFAYKYARKHAHNPKYSFGTGKVNVLGGFASAITLAIVAFMMLIESIERLINPHVIEFNQAIIIACFGLVINIVSAFLLKDDHHHHEHDHNHHHHDHNLRAAYMHVLADALTSLLAIIALVFGKYFGWNWMDSIMGIVGGVIIIRWSYGLLKQTGPILLDESINADYKKNVTDAIERDSDNQIVDIHIWKISANHHAAIISIATHFPNNVGHYKSLLKEFHKLSHLTIEINTCKTQ